MNSMHTSAQRRCTAGAGIWRLAARAVSDTPRQYSIQQVPARDTSEPGRKNRAAHTVSVVPTLTPETRLVRSCDLHLCRACDGGLPESASRQRER